MRYSSFGISQIVNTPSFYAISSGKTLSVVKTLQHCLNSNDNVLFSFDATGLIRFIKVSNCFRFLYIVSEAIHLFRTDKWTLEKSCIPPKRVTSCTHFIYNDHFRIIFSDKTGDVYLFEHEHPTYLLGHLLVVNALQVDSRSNYIFTSEKDCRVRATLLPYTQVIHGYLHGHTNTVSSLERLFIDDYEYLVSSTLSGELSLFRVADLTDCSFPIHQHHLPDSRFLSILCSTSNLVVAAHCSEQLSADHQFTLSLVSFEFINGLLKSRERSLTLAKGLIPTSASFDPNHGLIVSVCCVSNDKSSDFLLSITNLTGDDLVIFNIEFDYEGFRQQCGVPFLEVFPELFETCIVDV
ncbi:hypothetical protein P9112_014118 [Eukaryota sp. TZLM1-RC]